MVLVDFKTAQIDSENIKFIDSSDKEGWSYLVLYSPADERVHIPYVAEEIPNVITEATRLSGKLIWKP